MNTYLRIFYSSFPLKKVRYKTYNKAWLTPGIKISCANKRKLFLEQRHRNDPQMTTYYKKYCRILTKVIKLAKQRYYNSILTRSNNKTKTTWHIVKNNSNMNPSTHNITSIGVDGNASFDGQIIAETFNKYFVAVAQNINVKNHNVNALSNQENPISYLSRAFTQPFPTMNFKCVSTTEVENITKSLKTKNSHGYDEISTKILKLSINYISSPLTYICNRMLLTGIFPTRLKYAEVKPIFKKGDKNTTSNYRPISLLTSFSKIFEKVIYNRIYHHINHNHILANEQFGFRHASSTDIASYNLTTNILTAFSNKLLVGGIFCDLQKAFDCVNHDILLSKMEFYGISGKATNLIKSYLQDRRQRTLVDCDSRKYYSEWDCITDGVPQGSILGPLLFLLYVNDIPSVISDTSKPVLYADDTSLIITNSNSQMFEKNINTAILQLNKWFSSNRLSLNLEKTHYMQFLTKNSRATDLHISYENRQISRVHSTKFLGLEIDENLSWHCHIDQMIPKLKKVTYVIRSLKLLLPVKTLQMVYFSIFHSLISYGIIFWGSSTYSNIIFKTQKRIVRIITNSGNKDSCRNLFKELRILPLQSQYIFSLLMFVVKKRTYSKRTRISIVSTQDLTMTCIFL